MFSCLSRLTMSTVRLTEPVPEHESFLVGFGRTRRVDGRREASGVAQTDGVSSFDNERLASVGPTLVLK
jgi:hypothetical protein